MKDYRLVLMKVPTRMTLPASMQEPQVRPCVKMSTVEDLLEEEQQRLGAPFNLEGLSLPEDFDSEVLTLVTYLMVDTMPEPLRSRVVERMSGASLPKGPGRIVLPS